MSERMTEEELIVIKKRNDNPDSECEFGCNDIIAKLIAEIESLLKEKSHEE